VLWPTATPEVPATIETRQAVAHAQSLNDPPIAGHVCFNAQRKRAVHPSAMRCRSAFRYEPRYEQWQLPVYRLSKTPALTPEHIAPDYAAEFQICEVSDMRYGWQGRKFLERHFGIVIAIGLVAGLSALAALGYTP
jgi:hypothetical protein